MDVPAAGAATAPCRSCAAASRGVARRAAAGGGDWTATRATARGHGRGGGGGGAALAAALARPLRRGRRPAAGAAALLEWRDRASCGGPAATPRVIRVEAPRRAHVLPHGAPGAGPAGVLDRRLLRGRRAGGLRAARHRARPRRAPWTARPVEALVVTHHHEDHMGGAAALRAARGVVPHAHPAAVPLLADGFEQEPYRRLAWGRPPRIAARALGAEVATRSCASRSCRRPATAPTTSASSSPSAAGSSRATCSWPSACATCAPTRTWTC